MTGPGRAPDGLSVEQAAHRLAPLVHLLSALSRRAGGWLAHEPRLERKIALADHLDDDARAAHDLSVRVGALAPEIPGAPEGATLALLDRLDACADAAAHLEVAYGTVKPVVIAAADAYLAVADPLLERPTVAIALELRADQSRHVDELPSRHEPELPPVDGLAAGAGESRGAAQVPGAEPAARDAFLELVENRPSLDDVRDALHALLHACLTAGERVARQYHDTGHPGLARRASVHMRHAAVVDRLLAAHGSGWGERPVGPPHDDPYVVAEAVAVQHPSTARVLGHLLADQG